MNNEAVTEEFILDHLKALSAKDQNFGLRSAARWARIGWKSNWRSHEKTLLEKINDACFEVDSRSINHLETEEEFEGADEIVSFLKSCNQ